VTFKSIAPLLPFRHETFVEAVIEEANAAAGPMMVAATETEVHPLESVTVTV
jgi:hypothetical protein